VRTSADTHRAARLDFPSSNDIAGGAGNLAWPFGCNPVVDRRRDMLRYAVIFLIIAIIAAVFGFGGIAGDAAWIAKILLVVFLILAVLSFLFGRKGP
jgi:uncharacterized membrane protein YtjA (UPF0391 family)